MALSDRKVRAPLSGFERLGDTAVLQQAIQPRLFQHFEHPTFRDTSAKLQILLQRCVEKIGFLRHHRDIVTQLDRMDRLDIAAVKIDTPLLRREQPAEQFLDCTLPRTRRTDDSDLFTRFDCKCHIRDRRGTRSGIGKGNMIE